MRFVSIFFSTLSSLTFSKLLKVFWLGISHPLFTYLYTYASFKAFVKAKELYPETSSTNGKGNAFRHAYWCCLIMMYFCKISSPKKSARWCKKYTDFHEDLFPNKPLETKMDKHNNSIGIDYFLELLSGTHRQFFESTFFIKGLQSKVEHAIMIKSLDEKFDESQLIYLE